MRRTASEISIPVPVMLLSVSEVRTRRVDQRWVDRREWHSC
jgi:hypothetical protein